MVGHSPLARSSCGYVDASHEMPPPVVTPAGSPPLAARLQVVGIVKAIHVHFWDLGVEEAAVKLARTLRPLRGSRWAGVTPWIVDQHHLKQLQQASKPSRL